MSLAGVNRTSAAPPRVATASFRAPPPGRGGPASAAPPGLGRLPLGPLGQRTSVAPEAPAPPPRPVTTPRPKPPDDDEIDTRDDATHRRVSFEVGSVVYERYALLRPLGEGALGGSWVAFDQRARTAVVLKVVADMLVTNDRERADLAEKLGMFAGRTLPGVVMPREVFAVPGSVVVVYPHVEAASLRAVIDARHGQGARFTPEECLRVALSLVASVQAMHSASPHGALWPQNVLVTARGLLLVDGFLATSVAPDRLAARVEHHASVAPFCAPEITAGRRPTASADLYGVGAILAELAGGAPPGSGPDLAAVSPELHRAVATLLDREPARRPAGIRMVLDALTAAAGFAQRPSDSPLAIPDSVLAADDATPAALDPPTLPPTARAADVVILAAHEPAPPAAPEAPAAEAPADGPPGRLRGPTATLPLAGARPPPAGVQSGPPPSLAVKSGPPPAIAPASGPPPAIAVRSGPPQPVAPKPVSPKPISPQPIAARPAAPRPVAPMPRAFPIPTAPTALTSDAPADARMAFKTLPSINEAIRAPKAVPLPPRSAASAPPPSAPARPPASLPARPATTLPAPATPSAAPRSMPAAASPAAPLAPPARAPLPPPRSAPPMPRPPLSPPSNAPPPTSPAAGMRPPPPSAPPSASPPPSRAPLPPSRASLPPPRQAAVAPGRDRSFDDDAIDPKLLRVARMLDDERRRDQSGEAPPSAPPRGRLPGR